MHIMHIPMHVSHYGWQECWQENVVVIVHSACPQDFGTATPTPAHGIIVPIFREDQHLRHD
jgi:hypothetical protein